ncbi:MULTISPECIES: ATP-dependent DNA helicase DinG [Xenorhabdus]|uniref:ATP-dependent DNA helicase DinG n=1 Tax=Xenorhabdus ehlersii TaxID=290111 RepID=A0A2D0IY87_9GAMM|nr:MULTISPECIES: ATP-dependent DNA helicase DinG [Xenorhabdus]MBC8947810.1 ATP-dependent DNA helicase dinG [Xenorhabdus sp. TS4]MBC8948788.1 ATP-dependent DNA helicase dinG [Xenorhabdus sp. TS4]PHM25304.1 ATP-dependent DNA helicase dinG [Xenorhabdus ehlersii]PHM26881.1 ATP-dependent DNA helicase dinG [Xenorhabdus ehlersii]RKE90435.1 ATP-dependent DNA helicase DinG [Xenorhabdus ehlersii]
MALSSSIKKQISQWYKSLSTHIDGFIPRAPQRQMIAEVAKTLADEEGRHLVIEAPTGVGKTLSYLIPGIAISRAKQKPLVVSTANVALQDQIYSKDLPLLRKIIPDLKFTGAFGRARYVCPRNLEAICAAEGEQIDLMFLVEDQTEIANSEERELCRRLRSDYTTFVWDGLRDHHKLALADSLWTKISTDKMNCLARNCQFYSRCPFFLARREIEDADVVVANHSLVMAALESESVLPEAKNLLLVLDEGHHIPEVARDALEVEGEITLFQLNGQLDAFIRHVEQYLVQFRPTKPPALANIPRLQTHCATIREYFTELAEITQALLPERGEAEEYLFELGKLPDSLLLCCQQLFKLTDGLRGLAEAILNDLSDQTAKQDIVRLHRAILQSSRILGYFENITRLWRLASQEESSHAPISKWLTRRYEKNQSHLYFHCAGIRVSEQLTQLLWRTIPHVVVTSATLCSLNSFSRIQELTGLHQNYGDRFISLSSPFEHVRQGRLVIPQMTQEPTIQHEMQHLEEMSRYFRSQLMAGKHRGMLVLFSSQRAMEGFLTFVTDLRLMLLVQGDQPRYRLVETHGKRIDEGQTSILVGLQSFAEGLDLKGDYLSQVHIHKIAFPPVTNPVIITESAWLKSLKRYPFEVQSLPSASFNLIQQVGRLIRSHECYGDVVIYDTRLFTKRYGSRLLNSLPVFPIERPKVPSEKELAIMKKDK